MALKLVSDEDLPDWESQEHLLTQIAAIRAQLQKLEKEEPEDMESHAYDTWANRHEALEDRLDDLIDLLEERKEL